MASGISFVEPDEKIIAAIGNSYVDSVLSGKGAQCSVGILTDKHVYYYGKNLRGSLLETTSTTEEAIASVEDVTMTRFVSLKKIGLLIASILLLVFGAYVYMNYYLYALVVALFLIGIALLVAYFLSAKSYFEIVFPGGNFLFKLSWYHKEEIIHFQRMLHIEKEKGHLIYLPDDADSE